MVTSGAAGGSRRHSGPSLLTRFAVVSLVLALALGWALGLRTSQVVEERARAGAITTTEASIRFVVAMAGGTKATHVAPTQDQVVRELVRRQELLTSAVHAIVESGQLVAVEAVLPDGTMVARQSEVLPVGTRGSFSPEVLAVFRTGTSSSAVLLRDDPQLGPFPRQLADRYGDLVTVRVPVRLMPTGPVVVVIQAYARFAPVEAQAHRDAARLQWVLGIGLAVFWAVLFRLVQSASRRLRGQLVENERLATHDALTGLPNRALLRDRVDQAVRDSARGQTHVALLLLDLDRFKEVNDTLGHHHGDLLLQQVGPRLRAVLREGDTVARLGGDEFVVLLPGLDAPEDGAVLAAALVDALREPFTVDGTVLDLDVSVGVAVTPEHGLDLDGLLQRADVAMYVAKEAHAGVVVYDAGHDRHSPDRLARSSELRRAIEGPGQLVLAYQPKADLRTGVVREVEALVRWEHPVQGLLPPGEFIPLAEQTGLVRPLTLRVLADALAQARQWQDDGIDLRVAVNISARCLTDSAFPEQVAGLLAAADVAADRVELELTESAIMTDPDGALLVMRELAALGLQLSIDDFGTGYSSMAYLKRLPVHQLKIDRTFVTRMDSDDSDAAIVRSVLDLARNLDLRVVAEGVETQPVWDELTVLGCDAAQGYLLARPMPAADVAGWVRARSLPVLPVPRPAVV